VQAKGKRNGTSFAIGTNRATPYELPVDPTSALVHLPDLRSLSETSSGSAAHIERRCGDGPFLHALQLSVAGDPHLALREDNATSWSAPRRGDGLRVGQPSVNTRQADGCEKESGYSGEHHFHGYLLSAI
jgi:hypothetical protein